MLKLYDYFRSSACFRVRIALHLKHLNYEISSVHLTNNNGEQFSERYQTINPQCLVPTLQDGAHIITQSLAIIEYLEEKHPTPSLLPEDPTERAQVRAFALAIAADMHPLNNLRVLHYLTDELSINAQQKQQWYQHWMTIGLSALEKQLRARHKTSTFCFGETPTLADICLVPQLFNARRFACDIHDYENLIRVDKNCQNHPAFTKAWPTESSADASLNTKPFASTHHVADHQLAKQGQDKHSGS